MINYPESPLGTVNICFFKDSGMYHLTPKGYLGFDIPVELWRDYLGVRTSKKKNGWKWSTLEEIHKRNPATSMCYNIYN